MSSLKLNDEVMIRDARFFGNNTWKKGRVVNMKKTNSIDALTVEYCDDSATLRKLTCWRYSPIVMPLDDDVASALAFGPECIPFLKDLRIGK